MSGWVALLLLVAVSLGLLWVFHVRGPMLQLSVAALLFGAAGYAVIGRPGLPSSPRSAEERQPPILLTNLRHAFFGEFTPTEHWLIISESLARRGKTQDAAGVLQSAV
ncbi:MAG TPA: cytochrome C biosynthesis protein, partial [Sphingomicrobium sp.]